MTDSSPTDLSGFVSKYPAYLKDRTPTLSEVRDIQQLENISTPKYSEKEQSFIDEVLAISSTPMNALEQKTRVRLSYSRESLSSQSPLCEQDELDVYSITKDYVTMASSLNHLYAILNEILAGGSQLTPLLEVDTKFTTKTNSIVAKLQNCTITCVPKDPTVLFTPLQVPSSLWNDTVKALRDITYDFAEFNETSSAIILEQEKYINELTSELKDFDELSKEIGETRRNCIHIAEMFQQIVSNDKISDVHKVKSALIGFRSTIQNLKSIKDEKFFTHCESYAEEPLTFFKKDIIKKNNIIERQNELLLELKSRNHLQASQLAKYENIFRDIKSHNSR